MRVKEARDKISISSSVTSEGDLYFMSRNKGANEDDIMAFLERFPPETEGFLYIYRYNIITDRSRKVKLFLFDHSNRHTTRRIPATLLNSIV